MLNKPQGFGERFGSYLQAKIIRPNQAPLGKILSTLGRPKSHILRVITQHK